MYECLRHLDLLSLSPQVPKYRDSLGYVEEESKVSRIKISAENLTFG
jgi:hypothetical protein